LRSHPSASHKFVARHATQGFQFGGVGAADGGSDGNVAGNATRPSHTAEQFDVG
jgi:hypothetical protein